MKEINLAEQADHLKEQIICWRRALHRCPEIGLNNPETAANITRILKELGVADIKTGLAGGSGVTGMIHGKIPGKCLGIRADTDALPVREETGLPFASVNGKAHACGHDGHSAMLLGAARLLLNNRDHLQGSVKLIFQPGEEYGIGAQGMIESGVLLAPRTDAMLGLHIGSLYEGFFSGEVGYLPERFGFCVTSFEAEFRGVSAHTSMQHKSVDAIVMASFAVGQLQVIMARERHCFSPAVISVGTIHGGVKNNIIADRCVLTGTIRSDNDHDQLHYEKRLETIFASVAQSMGGSCTTVFPLKLESIKIDKALLGIFKRSAAKIVGEKVRQISILNTAGEDFSAYSKHIPAFFFFLCATYGDERDYPHHHPAFDINETALPAGAGILAQTGLDWQK